VIGLGGFACVPIVLAATRLGIPTILLEQNAIPGRAVRWLSRRVSTVCVSFDATLPLLPSRTRAVVTGNPVRSEIATLATNRTRSPDLTCTLLVLGGSQGAQPINQAMIEWSRTADPANLRIIHQTGAGQDEAVRTAYTERRINCEVAPFFTDMASLYRRATFGITRAGATTLAELACAGCPAILIPYPQAVDNHQLRNAELFTHSSAAQIVLQQATPVATANLLSQAINLWRSDPLVRFAAAEQMVKRSRPNAAANVAAILHK